MSPANEPEVQPLSQEEVAEKPETTEVAEEKPATTAEETKEEEAKTDDALADGPSSPEVAAHEHAPGKSFVVNFVAPSIPARASFCTLCVEVASWDRFQPCKRLTADCV
jgi:hypothetical protein